jgi:nickel superoxide dismutase
MMRLASFCMTGAGVLALAGQALAHCQIPCGIYNDELRVQLIEEHITTIEKSMKQAAALGGAATVDYNQLVRWIVNKEEHAQKIQDIVAAYFLAQRVKPQDPKEEAAYGEYIRQLTLLHRIQIAAMKAKQSTDLAHVATLKELVKEFRAAYFGVAAGHKH